MSKIAYHGMRMQNIRIIIMEKKNSLELEAKNLTHQKMHRSFWATPQKHIVTLLHRHIVISAPICPKLHSLQPTRWTCFKSPCFPWSEPTSTPTASHNAGAAFYAVTAVHRPAICEMGNGYIVRDENCCIALNDDQLYRILNTQKIIIKKYELSNFLQGK